MKSGKVWGNTTVIVANHACELHRIHVQSGGFCSKHLHAHKFNVFTLVSGRLSVYVEKPDQGLVDRTVLTAGDTLEVAPGQVHWFEAEEDTVAYELYYAPELSAADIVRKTSGGRKPL